MDREPDLQIEDEDLARLLRAAGRREPMPETLKQDWEAAFRRELAARRSERRAGRRWLLGATAAAAVVAGLLVLRPWYTSGDSAGPAVHVVALAGSSKLDARELRQGEQLLPGSVIQTGTDGRVAIAWGAYDLRLDADSVLALSGDRVDLRRGRLYASDDPEAVKRVSLAVTTPHGSVRDLGTQFIVVVSPERSETIVRRGAVLVDSGGEALQARGGDGSASRVVFDERQRYTAAAGARGPAWDWIHAVTPEFVLEGKTAHQFLLWSTGETGLSIEYGSPDAEYYARATTLHGTIPALDPERAVAVVLQTTDLRAEQRGHLLHLSLREPASE